MAQIVVIEEDRMAQAFAYSILRKISHHAIICRDASIAWAIVQDNPDIALILADLAIVEHDDMKLVDRLRSWQNTRTLPIVVMSEMLGAKTIARLTDQGIDDVLRKPLKGDEVEATITRLLRGPGTSTVRRQAVSQRPNRDA